MVAEAGPGGGEGDFDGGGKLRAFLIEVNTSPDVSHSTAVTSALVPVATADLLSLLLDEGQARMGRVYRSCCFRRPTPLFTRTSFCFMLCGVASLFDLILR